MLFFVQYVRYDMWVRFRVRMNGYKNVFRLYAVGKFNKMDNKLLNDHL